MSPHWPTWLKIGYVVFCLVVTTIVMTTWGWAIRPYTDAASAWIGASIGEASALLLLFVIAIAAIYANFRGQRS